MNDIDIDQNETYPVKKRFVRLIASERERMLQAIEDGGERGFKAGSVLDVMDTMVETLGAYEHGEADADELFDDVPGFVHVPREWYVMVGDEYDNPRGKRLDKVRDMVRESALLALSNVYHDLVLTMSSEIS